MNNYNFGLRGHDIANNFSDMCIQAREHDIKLLQFALAKTVTDVNFDVVGYDKELSARIKKQLDEFQLSTAVLGCYINPVDSDPVSRKTQTERFRNFIKYAKDFNADVIGTETGWKSSFEETQSDENYNDFLNAMLPAVDDAESEGVNIGIEPVGINTIYSVGMMKKMLDDVKSERLSVIMDFSNIILTPEIHDKQNDIIKSAFDTLDSKIKVIHLKDYTFSDGKKTFAPAGTGLLNIGLIFKCIEKMSSKPKIILDELPLRLYKETVDRIRNNY